MITHNLKSALRAMGHSEEQATAAVALTLRMNLLNASDWTQLPDSPLSAETKQQWATYRQALRDITKQPSFPLEIQWPVSPNNPQ